MVFPKTRKKRVNSFLAEDIAANTHEMACPKKKMSAAIELSKLVFLTEDIAVNIQKMPFQERKPLTIIPVFLGNCIIEERRKRKKNTRKYPRSAQIKKITFFRSKKVKDYSQRHAD
jgi:hypothetical protein